MSSYFDKQQAAFGRAVAHAGSKIPSKARQNLAPESAPSPAVSQASSNGDAKELKRKRDVPAASVVYSQPAETGFGSEAYTQVTYVIDFLKKKGEPKTLKEILDYLSQSYAAEQTKRVLAAILKKHGRILWKLDHKLKVQTWDSGTFEHKPILPIRNKQDLIAYLQRKADAQGVVVKDLKDGWPECEEALTELELRHKILVTRTKKDNYARMVWANDSTLYNSVDFEFTKMWYDIKLPEHNDDLVKKLIEAGQKPASEDPSKRVKAAPKEKPKKKRVARKGGKTTNTHMEHLLKNFDYLRK